MTELKKCPLCNSDCKIISITDDDYHQLEHHVVCCTGENCDYHAGYWITIEEAISHHNYRPIEEELIKQNTSLRFELHTLRFKESQEERFIWWVWNVYAKGVLELIKEVEAAKIILHFGGWSIARNLKDYTDKIYDGTYLDVEVSKEHTL
jgi:hypothetical protein